MKITLDKECQELVDKAISMGLYSTPDEVVNKALMLMQEFDKK